MGKRSNWLVVGIVAVALSVLLGLDIRIPTPAAASASVSSAPVKEVKPPDVNSLNEAFTTLAERVSPAVVNIYTKSEVKRPTSAGREDFEFFFGGRGMRGFPEPSMEGLGSGFVINEKEGYIVTNAHVVRMAGQNADEIMVKFNDEENGKGHAAKVIGADEITDVALLKLVDPKPGIKSIPLGDSDKSKVGEWVLAIGNPYGHTNTVTQGIVSALGRSLQGARAEFMQTSAGINPGNSGGPLINMNGEVVGINTAMDPRAQSIGFAIPINGAKTAIEQLMSTGRVQRAWMGIAIDDVSEEIAGYMKLKEAEGVIVKQVMENQPAAKAGMQEYDVITKIEGKDIKSTKDLFRSMEKFQAGQTVNIEVLRNHQARKLKVQIGEQPVNS